MSSTAVPAVRTRGLGVSIGGRTVLHDVDLLVGAGERVGLVGPSGAGKSMLVRALAGVLPVHARTTGRVDLVAPPAWVQQDPSLALHPSVRVGRQLARPVRRRLGRGGDRREAAARVRDVLAEVGLDAERVGSAVPAELSGGERQRVCVALALLTDAPVVLADEPTTSLDTLSQAAVLAALRRTTAALLLVTHDEAVAAALCTRTVRLAGGVVEDARSTVEGVA